MFALKNVYLIDGTGKEPMPQCTILMEHEKFKEIGTDIPVPSGAMVMDLQGKTVIPGLIDAHVHISGSSR
ncbi:MAG: amidohydrolase family protein, partial [Lachnospiraceae bacterium]|nr:amidohydrolase family protein [Lachnospiraceae bacterium]